MRNLKITIEYDGTNYHGWQIQASGRTVQGELTRALSLLDERYVIVHGAGRTDAGVHAEGQVASFKMERPFDLVRLRDGINGNLDRDIRVTRAEFVDDRFHARLSAKQKTYRYHIWTREVLSPFTRRYVYHFWGKLNVPEMGRAAAILEGTHDFRAFSTGDLDTERTVRTISSLTVEQTETSLLINVSANGFLRYMVRAIAGTLLDVGRGRRSAESVAQCVASQDRGQAGATILARGLTLVRVDY
ncbi:MAG TPA: tRNA pseudouridine(38-40) synthase TruA [Blastocatellia bacterium]|nr:tRNA pseudouridine(38-40) synthase TruA [Blastocatellia bacterium]